MIKSIKIISFIIIFGSLFVLIYLKVIDTKDIVIQNRIIDNVFNVDTALEQEEALDVYSDDDTFEYFGYIYIPRFNIKRIIKVGTSDDILDAGFVGLHSLSDNLDGDNLIILAGHNIKRVFAKLHNINIGDTVFIGNKYVKREFVVYDIKKVSENDISYLKADKKNELLLITCAEDYVRLIVLLKEVL